MDRWRGRGGPATAAIFAAAVILAVGVVVVGARPELAALGEPRRAWQLVVRANDESVLLSVALPEDRFVLRYRNSIYGSVAEERFTVNAQGQMVLVEVAADDPVVLDEYYRASRPTVTVEGDARPWRAVPDAPLLLDQLPLAATPHGRRTLIVEDEAFPLWPLAEGGAPTLLLRAEHAL